MELKYFNVKYGKNEVNIPYYEIIGKSSGPIGFLAAGIHGDDLNSINVLRNFIRVAKTIELQKRIKGILLVFPILNVSGFENGVRNVLEDGKDLDLQFGKKYMNSFSSAIAFELTHNFFKKSDFGILFLDSRSNLLSLPHAKIFSDNEIDFARNFGSKVIVKTETVKNIFPKVLSKNYGTRVLTAEVGCKNHISFSSVKPIMQSIKNILVTENMLDINVNIPKKIIVLDSKNGLRAKESGILDLKCELGQKIVKNQKLGTIFYPISQKTEILTAEKSGFLFAKRLSDFVRKGQIIVSIV